MKYFSLFTGVGGLDYGLADWNDCAGFSEIKNSSIDLYKKHYPTHKNYGDITTIVPEELPDFDILTGGFPCQSFSLAGLRKGFLDPKDKKGQMIFYIYDILVAKKPKFAVLENVKGIHNHNEGRTFNSVVKLLTFAGYNVRVLLLNALNYGSAQNRERVIFLCSQEPFEKKEPQIIDQTKLFRDIREEDHGQFDWIDYDKYKAKIEQSHNFSLELIGGYDRVGTLTTQMGCGDKAVYDEKQGEFRLLTPLECERLQGFEDGWTSGASKNARYFALGNAVNCNMSNYLFKDYLKGLWWEEVTPKVSEKSAS